MSDVNWIAVGSDLKSSMERFIATIISLKLAIVDLFKIQYGEIYRSLIMIRCVKDLHLKSSMERFIGYGQNTNTSRNTNLKSSMERFIAVVKTA